MVPFDAAVHYRAWVENSSHKFEDTWQEQQPVELILQKGVSFHYIFFNASHIFFYTFSYLAGGWSYYLHSVRILVVLFLSSLSFLVVSSGMKFVTWSLTSHYA